MLRFPRHVLMYYNVCQFVSLTALFRHSPQRRVTISRRRQQVAVRSSTNMWCFSLCLKLSAQRTFARTLGARMSSEHSPSSWRRKQSTSPTKSMPSQSLTTPTSCSSYVRWRNRFSSPPASEEWRNVKTDAFFFYSFSVAMIFNKVSLSVVFKDTRTIHVIIVKINIK